MRSPATCMLVLAIFRISSLNAMTVKSAVLSTPKTDTAPTATKETGHPKQIGYALDTGSIAKDLNILLAAPAAATATIGHNTASANNKISAELELDAQIKGKLTITGNQAMSNSHPTYGYNNPLHGLNNNEIYNLMQYLGRA